MSEDKLSEEAIDWLVKLRGGNLSDSETSAFADWLLIDAEHRVAFAKAEDFFNEMVVYAKIPAVTIKKSEPLALPLSQVLTLKPKPKHLGWLTVPLTMAAAWLIAVSLVLPQQDSLLDNLMSDYHTQTGEVRDIQLVDGSHLLLNTNTAVSVDYQETKRLLTVHHGQVRFTVAKDHNRPFEVKTDDLVVRALGTIFEVYRKDNNEIKVTVQEHAVAARIQHSDDIIDPTVKSMTIQTGQQLNYHGETVLPEPITVNLVQTTAWQQQLLYINNRPLSELVAELDRYRMGRIYLTDDKLKTLKVTGVFPLTDTEDVLSSVKQVLALQETKIGPWWVLLHR